jgi:hypothetical protein
MTFAIPCSCPSFAHPVCERRHLLDAWKNGTRTLWGKIALVSFYAYLLYNIVGAVFMMVTPPGSMDCFYSEGGAASEYAVKTMTWLVWQSNLWAIGFFLYAAAGGIRFWNVTMVAVFSLVSVYQSYLWISQYESWQGGPPPGCVDGGNGAGDDSGAAWMIFMWYVVPAWVVGTWAAALFEHFAVVASVAAPSSAINARTATGRGDHNNDAGPKESTPFIAK